MRFESLTQSNTTAITTTASPTISQVIHCVSDYAKIDEGILTSPKIEWLSPVDVWLGGTRTSFTIGQRFLSCQQKIPFWLVSHIYRLGYQGGARLLPPERENLKKVVQVQGQVAEISLHKVAYPTFDCSLSILFCGWMILYSSISSITFAAEVRASSSWDLMTSSGVYGGS